MSRSERYLREAADRVMIQDLLARYAWAVDYGKPADFAAVFVKNGRIEVPESHMLIEGPERIQEFAAAIQQLVPGLHHVMSNFVIDITGDRARGRCQLNEFMLRPEAVYPNLQGWYEDDYRFEHGRWWIEVRRIHVPVPEVMRAGKVGEYFAPLIEKFREYVVSPAPGTRAAGPTRS